MAFSSPLWAHLVCKKTVRPPIQIMAKGRVGLPLKPSLRAHSSDANSQAEDDRVYILGDGPHMNFFAHSLAKKPSPPPITLLFSRGGLAQQWNDRGKCIEIKGGDSSDRQYAFDTEFHAWADQNDRIVGPGAPRNGKVVICTNLIRNIICCPKSNHAIATISRIKHRLNEQSTILFTSSSLGTVEEIRDQLFPNSKSRPSFLVGVISHDILGLSTFCLVHSTFGAVSLRVLPHGQLVDARKDESNSAPLVEPSRYLIQQILDTPILAGKEVSTTEIIQALMEQLVSSAMINRLLSVIIDRSQDFTDNKKHYTRISSLRRLLLREASHVVRALPELQKDAGLAKQFLLETERRMMAIERDGKSKKDSMPENVEASGPKLPNKIDSLNEYIVKRGEQLGIDCLHNRTLVKMAKENLVINHSQIDEFFPPEHGS